MSLTSASLIGEIVMENPPIAKAILVHPPMIATNNSNVHTTSIRSCICPPYGRENPAYGNPQAGLGVSAEVRAAVTTFPRGVDIQVGVLRDQRLVDGDGISVAWR